jgi:hypothetical protein
MAAGAGPGVATRVLGARVKRLEDPALLAGQGRYLDDIRLPGMLHAAFVRSPHAARVTGVGASAGLDVPGVVAALTRRDLAECARPLPGSRRGFRATAWPALAGSRVRFVGEAVAVLARGRPMSRSTGERVAAGYEALPPVVDVDAASPRALAPSRDGARQRARAAAGPPGRRGRRVRPRGVRIHERFGPRPLLSHAPRAEGSSPAGDDRSPSGQDADPVRLSHRAGPELRAGGEPRACDRPRHRGGLRAKDARDAGGHRRGRAGPRRRAARQVDGDAPRQLRGRLAGARSPRGAGGGG